MTFSYTVPEGISIKKRPLPDGKGRLYFERFNRLCESWFQFVSQCNHFLDAIFRQVTFLELSQYFW